MILTRRSVLQIGGGLLAALPFGAAGAWGAAPVDITMRGNADGSRVWFEPIGVLIESGQTIRWTNKDPGNSHTATAYHPDNEAHPRRIPAGAQSWNSDYLLPDESFAVVLTAPGVYDYYCVPHEHAGMVGRIVVAGEAQEMAAPASVGIPEIAEKAFPSVEEILRQGRVSVFMIREPQLHGRASTTMSQSTNSAMPRNGTNSQPRAHRGQGLPPALQAERGGSGRGLHLP